METFPSSWEDFSLHCKNGNLNLKQGLGQLVFPLKLSCLSLVTGVQEMVLRLR